VWGGPRLAPGEDLFGGGISNDRGSAKKDGRKTVGGFARAAENETRKRLTFLRSDDEEGDSQGALLYRKPGGVDQNGSGLYKYNREGCLRGGFFNVSFCVAFVKRRSSRRRRILEKECSRKGFAWKGREVCGSLAQCMEGRKPELVQRKINSCQRGEELKLYEEGKLNKTYEAQAVDEKTEIGCVTRTVPFLFGARGRVLRGRFQTTSDHAKKTESAIKILKEKEIEGTGVIEKIYLYAACAREGFGRSRGDEKDPRWPFERLQKEPWEKREFR